MLHRRADTPAPTAEDHARAARRWERFSVVSGVLCVVFNLFVATQHAASGDYLWAGLALAAAAAVGSLHLILWRRRRVDASLRYVADTIAAHAGSRWPAAVWLHLHAVLHDGPRQRRRGARLLLAETEAWLRAGHHAGAERDDAPPLVPATLDYLDRLADRPQTTRWSLVIEPMPGDVFTAEAAASMIGQVGEFTASDGSLGSVTGRVLDARLLPTGALAILVEQA